MSIIDKTLSNGLRVVIEPMAGVESAAGGFMARTGSRDEVPPQAGVSHFLEHMMFKGTPKRQWHQITIDFDNIGSSYNAFTSKERTFYYGWVRPNDLETQLEILADMMRSTLPPDEFTTEKKVVLEEIAMSHDQIEHHVYDLIHEKAFDSHPLSWPVLGTEETVGALTRDQMNDYLQQRYNPANMVLVVAGNVDPDHVLKTAEKLTADWPKGSPRPERQQPARCGTGKAVLQMERFKQQAVCMNFPAPPVTDERDGETADVVASILGGANSRFYWNIVQAGVAPIAGAWRVDYCDSGLMVLYGFAEAQRIEKLADAIRREADKLTREGATDAELQRVRNRRRTGMVVEAESPYYRLSQIADDIDTYGRTRTLEERMRRIDEMTTADIAAYLERWPITGDGYLVSVGPRNWPEA